ncbi:MAG: protein kinase [Oscillospiraceae bacterium]|nr:protein kinase [Oscillospiraceae bacterium]
MAKNEFEPGKNLGEEIKGLNRQELCELLIELCRVIHGEAGAAYRGGVYPENLRRDAAGELVIGDGRDGDWEGQELCFIAPELYWHGTKSQAADVYSLGLLLYYGLTGGKLPFEGESSNAQLTRMSGKAIRAPKGCGARLREILEKAAAFREEDRYQSVGELAVMLESCLDNKYLDETDGARGIFRKDDGDLSDIEKMMMAIISGDGGAAETPKEETAEEPPVEEVSAEEAMEEILAAEAPEKPEKDLIAESAEDLVAEFFGRQEEEEPAAPVRPAPSEEAEPDDVRVYEPGREKRQPIPILVEEKNPELAPVVPRPQPRRTAVKYSDDPVRSQQIGQEVRKRRKRPVLVVLLLCVLLFGVAAGARIFLREWNRPDTSIGTMTVSTPTPGENAPQLGENGTGSIVTPLPDPLIGTTEVRYEVVVDDAGWIEARAKAESMGGHLAVITSPKELEKVAEAIGQAGLARAWIGCYRLNGEYVWETDEYVSYYPWDENEPSEVDAYDNAPEDFIMLWNHNGWCYNDCRENPARDFPEYYSGSIGFVVEYGVGEKQ